MSTTSKAPPPSILNISLTARQVTFIAGVVAVLLVVFTAFTTRHAVHASNVVLDKREWRCDQYRERVVQSRERRLSFEGSSLTFATDEERDTCLRMVRTMK